MSKRDSIIIISFSILLLILVFCTTVLPNIILAPKTFTPVVNPNKIVWPIEMKVLPMNTVMSTILDNAYQAGEIPSLNPKEATTEIKNQLAVAYANWKCPTRFPGSSSEDDFLNWNKYYQEYLKWVNN